jgi:transmembrane sensor
MMDNNLFKAKALLSKYREGTSTNEEKAWVEDWYLKLNTEDTDLSDEELASDLRDLQSRLAVITTAGPSRKYPGLIAIAATLLLVSGLSLYLFIVRDSPPSPTQTIVINDIAAGTNKAVLTLSNGKTISLSDAGNGLLTTDADAQISKTGEGQIKYVSREQNGNQTNATNIIETPMGGQFQVVLSDGTKVFLNAASSLKYPTQFTGTARKVELKGEGYFEVTHNEELPFIVKTERQSVRVLGTHFNINSYTDEGKTVTTLQQGSVQVEAGSERRLLRPGSQTVLLANSNLNVQPANMETALAWKNNKMAFEDAGIEEIMRQVARWYDLDIKYEGKIPDDTFSGTINRQSNLTTVLKMFALSAIKFKVEQTGKRTTLIIKT